mgnify:CR=1 FL=1
MKASLLLLEAVKEDNIEKVEKALSVSANIKFKHKLDGSTPLIIASSRGNTKIVALLLREGAINDDYKDNWGESALSIAISFKDWDTVKILDPKNKNIPPTHLQHGSHIKVSIEAMGSGTMIISSLEIGKRTTVKELKETIKTEKEEYLSLIHI